MQLELLLDRLDGVRGNVARCPAHDDQQASLSFREAEDGTILLHCHAGCLPEDVCSALGIRMSDLFPEAEEVVYTYLDEQRRPLYDSVRKGHGSGKRFFQRKYVGSTTEDNMEDVRRVLYQLPDILEADPSRWVFITEGEKDADAVWANGGVATTNVGGAEAWEDSYAECLKGRHVTVVQDKDDAGRKRGVRVLRSLRNKVATLRLVEARVGNDAYDHFAAGFGMDDFVEPSLFIPIDFSKPTPETKWLLDSYIAAGDLALLSGAPGLGKSWWAMALAVAVANSTDFLGCAVRGVKVLYFDEEQPEEVVYDRLKRLGHRKYENLRYIWNQGVRLDTHPERVEQEVLMFQPDLLVFDSLTRIHSKEENSVGEIGPILNDVIRPLARDMGAGVVLIHHHDKQGYGPRGSGDIVASVDCSIDLRGTPGTGKFTQQMSKSRRRLSGEKTFIVVEDLPGVGTRLRASPIHD